METSIVDECWKKLEYRRIMREMLAEDTTLRVEIERKLRVTREDEKAVEAILAEEVASTKRLEKVERLKVAWKKRMAIREYDQMLT